MSYSSKVKECKPIIDRIRSLKDGDTFNILYKEDIYKVSAYKTFNDEMSYSVWKSYSGMNVSKVGNTSLTLYSFDMMSQKTTYRLDLSKCTIVDLKADLETKAA